jgi:hypothetical protein
MTDTDFAREFYEKQEVSEIYSPVIFIQDPFVVIMQEDRSNDKKDDRTDDKKDEKKNDKKTTTTSAPKTTTEKK